MHEVPVPAELSVRVLTEVGGGPVRLGSLWQDQPALVVFVRHFGCYGCSLNLCDLGPRLFQFEEMGIGVALVGHGRPLHVDGFLERMALTDKAVRVFLDPDLGAYRAAGFERSLWSVAGPVALFEQLRAWGDGHPNDFFGGDLRQQGGALLIHPDGTIRYRYDNRRPAAFAPVVELYDAALRLCVENPWTP